MKRRLLTVALALLLAVIGTAGVLMYVGQSDARALAGQQAVTVLIAAKPIPGGTSAAAAQAAGLLTSQTLPAASVTADALESITPELGELVTSAALPAGQLLLRRMLVPVGQTTGDFAVPEGMVAVSLQLCTQQGVAGFIRPGSAIAITGTEVPGIEAALLGDQAACAGPHTYQYGDEVTTSVVLPRVTVLAVGQAPAWVPPTSGGTATPAGTEAAAETEGAAAVALPTSMLLTLAMPLPDAQRLITLSYAGLPYAVLLPGSAP